MKTSQSPLSRREKPTSALSDTRSVVVIDDDCDVQRFLRFVLDSEPDLHVVAEGCHGEDAVSLAAERAPDVLVLVMMGPDVSGLQALPAICRSSPRTRVIIFSNDPGHVSAAKQFGAHAGVTRGANFESLLAAIRGFDSA
jgi:DNA-binding NarL/FixJ family response regulator